MTSKPRYISVVGVTTPEHMEAIDSFFTSDDPLPVIGIQSSQRTVKDPDYVSPNLRFPRFSEISGLTKCSANIVLHYNPHNAQPMLEETLSYQLGKALASLDLWGVQINGKEWPELQDIAPIKESRPELAVILQVSRPMMEISCRDISNRITQYQDSVDYILIDPSRGRGIPFDVQSSAVLYAEIKSLSENYGVVFAGGFSSENVYERIFSLANILGTTDFSIDTEGRLRDKVGDRFGQDILNLEKVAAFIRFAEEAYVNYESQERQRKYNNS